MTQYVDVGGGIHETFQARYCSNDKPDPVFEIQVGGNKGGTTHYVVLDEQRLRAMLAFYEPAEEDFEVGWAPGDDGGVYAGPRGLFESLLIQAALRPAFDFDQDSVKVSFTDAGAVFFVDASPNRGMSPEYQKAHDAGALCPACTRWRLLIDRRRHWEKCITCHTLVDRP